MYKNKATIDFMMSFRVFIIIFLLLASCKNDESVADGTAENRKGLGISASDLLSSDLYSTITVEIAYSQGFRPKQETIDGFTSFIGARLRKPGGINLIETRIPTQANGPFTTTEIRDIEDDFRSNYTTDTDIAVFVFFANDRSENDTNASVTLGTAYQNTSIVIYEKTLREVSTSQNFDLGFLEATTLHHEFGHLLGLVNILEDDIHTDHEDPAHQKHCLVEECLMYFEPRQTTIPRLLTFMERNTSNAIPVFDTELCLADLQAKGGR